MPTAEIITIGTELLLGETADTNTRFIARVLRGLGIDLFRAQTIGDNAGRITEAVRHALEHADIVITTGGLGPTVDDPTRQAIADSVGAALEFHPELWEQITARIARYGRTPTGNQKRQAYIPKDAIVIENPVGTAPAFIVEISSPSPLRLRSGQALTPLFAKHPRRGQGDGNKVVVSLPGVPREMETLLTDAIVPYLQKHFDLHAVLKIRTLHVSGLGEGMIDDQIGDLETLANPTVGLTAHSGVVDIRIAAKAETEAEAGRMIAAVEQDLRTRLGENIFGTDDCTLEGVTLEAMAQRGWTLACLEINLEGALLTRFARTGHPAYRDGSSPQVRPEALAAETESVRKQFEASTALGVAYSQDGEKQDIYIFLITPLGEVERHLTYGGHPGNARRWAVNMALDCLRRSAQEAG
ncbi:MAG: molybdopterin-binding protein [Chloroflexi bacterium]|nr:molybdopterin-binding protein [Chloroflexota bacterium]